MNLLINIFTFILIVTAFVLIVLVLMQKSNSDGGMSALGGGMAESTFGAETGNVLSTATIRFTVAFFVLSFGLYLAHVYQAKHPTNVDSKLPTVTAPAAAPVSSSLPAKSPASVPAKP